VIDNAAVMPAPIAAVPDVLHSERFVDATPGAVYATLLDEDTYLGHHCGSAPAGGRRQRGLFHEFIGSRS
jgi:hypothetical protein